jgi:hypothetical protein
MLSSTIQNMILSCWLCNSSAIGGGSGTRSGWGWRQPLNKGQPVAKLGMGNAEDATEATDGLGWRQPLSRLFKARGTRLVVQKPGAGIRGRREAPTVVWWVRAREGSDWWGILDLGTGVGGWCVESLDPSMGSRRVVHVGNKVLSYL